MAFDPTLPVEDTDLDAAQMRDQFNGLKGFIDTLQQQVNAQAALINQLILPQMNHDNTGAWSVTIIGTLPALWQVWVRSDLNTDWNNTASYTPANFPVSDIGLAPFGAQWWQIKVCGSDGSTNITPFSNIVSMGPVP